MKIYTENSNLFKSGIISSTLQGPKYVLIVAGDIQLPNKLPSSNEMVKPKRYKSYEMFQRNNNAKDKAFLSLKNNIFVFINVNIYRVSREECARLRENVP